LVFACTDNGADFWIYLVMHEKEKMDLSGFARKLFLQNITNLSGFACNKNVDLSGYARKVYFCNGKTLGIYSAFASKHNVRRCKQ